MRRGSGKENNAQVEQRFEEFGMICNKRSFCCRVASKLFGCCECTEVAHQSGSRFPAWVKAIVVTSFAVMTGTVGAEQWDFSWTSTVSGEGEEDAGGYHRESSISGELSGSYHVKERTLVLEESASGNWMDRHYSGGMASCGTGATYAEAFLFTESTNTYTITGPANEVTYTSQYT